MNKALAYAMAIAGSVVMIPATDTPTLYGAVAWFFWCASMWFNEEAQSDE